MTEAERRNTAPFVRLDQVVRRYRGYSPLPIRRLAALDRTGQRRHRLYLRILVPLCSLLGSTRRKLLLEGLSSLLEFRRTYIFDSLSGDL